MKLAIITNYWINADVGGITRFTEILVKHLKQNKIDVVVLFRHGDDPSNYKLPSNKNKFSSEAKRILKKEKPDAIFCQGGWFTQRPALHYKRKYKNTKVLTLIHTPFRKKMPFYKRFVNIRILNKFDMVGFVSKGLEHNVRNVAGLDIKSNIFILYPAPEVIYPSEDEVDEFKRRFDIKSKRIYLLGLGLTNIYIKKEGAKLLMQALSEIIINHPEVNLILTRKGSYTEELKTYANELDIKNHVIFTGDIPNQFVAMSVADIYTHISYGEGLPAAILEAMTFGKPIVASKVGGNPEAITNGYDGILVDNDVNEITEAVTRLIKNEELKSKYAINAYKTVNEKFTWEKNVAQFIKLCGWAEEKDI